MSQQPGFMEKFLVLKTLLAVASIGQPRPPPASSEANKTFNYYKDFEITLQVEKLLGGSNPVILFVDIFYWCKYIFISLLF